MNVYVFTYFYQVSMKKNNFSLLENPVLKCFKTNKASLRMPGPSIITICVNLKIFQAVMTTHSLFIQKGHHCTIAYAFISSVPNFSSTIIHFPKLINTFGIDYTLSMRCYTVQAHFAALENFDSYLKDVRRVLFKT